MKLGILGAGNMAQAMLRRWLDAGKLDAQAVWIADVDRERCLSLAKELGVNVAQDNRSLLRETEVVLLAVKPNNTAELFPEIQECVAGKYVLSIVTGLSTQRMQGALPGARVVRIMPNTPALVGEGVLVIGKEHGLPEEVFQWTQELFSVLGRVFLVEEKYFDAVVGLSGSGPAYVFVMIEAMADAGVLNGLPRALAYELAAQTMVGAGRMVLESGGHPGALKDAVSSPAGTTIEALYALEKRGFRGTVMEAVQVCTQKAKALRLEQG